MEGLDTRARSAWIRSPAFDGFFLLSGLWLPALVLALWAGRPDPTTGPVGALYLGLTATLWIGHRLGSGYLAYCTESYRPLLTAEPVRFVWGPLTLALGTLAFLAPSGFWPWPRGERIVAALIVDFGLLTYHFAAQHYGILSLYRLRARREPRRHARRADRAFALGIGGALVFAVDAILGEFHQDTWLHPWLPERALGDAFGTVRMVGTLAVAAATGAWLVSEARSSTPSAPRALYLASVSGLVLAALWLPPFVFVVLWTSQHWLAALGLTVAVARADDDRGRSGWLRFWQPISAKRWRVLALLTGLSVLLLPVFELEAVEPSERYGPVLFPDAWIAALDRSPWVPVLVALGFASAFVHYQLDRAVYRFSNPRVRAAARDLVAD